MYQVNVFYENKIEEIIYNCKTIQEASEERYEQIRKWSKIYENKGIEPWIVSDNLNIEIKEQD